MTDRGRHEEPPTVATLYERYGARMFHYALTVLGSVDEVDEVMQDVFLNVARRPKKVAKADSPQAYLFAMLRHEMGRFMKRKRRRAERNAANPVGQARFLQAPAGEDVSDEDAREVERALGELPVEQREAVVLKVYEGLTFREIGDVMKTSTDTAASRYRYGIAKLRATLSHGRESWGSAWKPT